MEHVATPAVDPAVNEQVPDPEMVPTSAVTVTVPVGVVGLEFVSVTVTVQVVWLFTSTELGEHETATVVL